MAHATNGTQAEYVQVVTELHDALGIDFPNDPSGHHAEKMGERALRKLSEIGRAINDAHAKAPWLLKEIANGSLGNDLHRTLKDIDERQRKNPASNFFERWSFRRAFDAMRSQDRQANHHIFRTVSDKQGNNVSVTYTYKIVDGDKMDLSAAASYRLVDGTPKESTLTVDGADSETSFNKRILASLGLEAPDSAEDVPLSMARADDRLRLAALAAPRDSNALTLGRLVHSLSSFDAPNDGIDHVSSAIAPVHATSVSLAVLR